MLHERVSPRTLGAARAWVFGLWLHRLLTEPFPEVAALPLAVFEPIGVLRLLPSSIWPIVCTAPVLEALRAILLVGAGVAMLGTPGYRVLAPLWCGVVTFQQGLVRGFGYVNHGELALLYAAWVLACFPAADAFALRRSPARCAAPVMYAAPMRIVAGVLAVLYAFIGIRRLVAGAPEIFVDGSILRWAALRALQGGVGAGHGLEVVASPWAATLLVVGFPVVTLLEALTPFCLASARFRWVWLGVMVPFHLATRAVLQIFFRYNLLLLPVFFTDFERWIGRLHLGAAECEATEDGEHGRDPLRGAGPGRVDHARLPGQS